MKVGILGDGLVSLTLAKALANKGIFVEIISSKKVKNISKFRTIGITKSNIDFYNKEILNIENLTWQINKIDIFSEKFKDKNLLSFQDGKEELFSIIRNYQLYESLNRSLKKNKFFKKKKLNRSDLFNKGYKLIINCDSSHPMNKHFFYKKNHKYYESFAYTTSIKHKKIKDNNIATQIFTHLGPIAFLPISNFETSIVFSINIKSNLSDFYIMNLIKKYNTKYQILKINKIEHFELSMFNLRSYHYKNVLAFGDLLHKIHPLAGQGFNMTIRDIKQLLNIINSKIDLGLDINESVCSEFESKSKHKNFVFSNVIDLVYEIFNFETKIKNDKLSKAIHLLGRNKSLNKLFTKFANTGIIS